MAWSYTDAALTIRPESRLRWLLGRRFRGLAVHHVLQRRGGEAGVRGGLARRQGAVRLLRPRGQCPAPRDERTQVARLAGPPPTRPPPRKVVGLLPSAPLFLPIL